MTKNQFRQLAKELGYSTSYSRHSNTFYLKELNKISYEETLERYDDVCKLTNSGFKVKYH